MGNLTAVLVRFQELLLCYAYLNFSTYYREQSKSYCHFNYILLKGILNCAYPI